MQIKRNNDKSNKNTNHLLIIYLYLASPELTYVILSSLAAIFHQQRSQNSTSTNGSMPYPLFMLTGWACIASGRDGEPSWGWLPAALCCSWDWLPVPLRCNMNWDGSIRLVRDGSVSPNKTSMLASSAPLPHHHNHFTALFLGPSGWAGARRELLDFMVQGEINRGRHIDHLAGCHSIQTNQCPPPPSSHIFYGPDALPAAPPTVDIPC